MNIGKTYFFKDGVVQVRDLTIYSGNIDGNPGDIQKLISTEEKALSNGNDSIHNIYKRYTDNGYSVIRIANDTRLDSGVFLEGGDYCLLPEVICEEDSINLLKVLDSVKDIENTRWFYIYNNRIDNNGNYNYDKIDSAQRNCKEKDIYKYVDILVKEKLRTLNDYEKEIINHYRTVDLNSIFIKDYANDYFLNNSNCAVIAISSDRVYMGSCTKEGHFNELLYLLRDFPGVDRSMTWTKISEVGNSILLQLYKNGVAIWFPSASCLTDFQKEELDNFLSQLENANLDKLVVDGKELLIAASYANDGKINPIVDSSDNYSFDDRIEIIRNQYLAEKKKA